MPLNSQSLEFVELMYQRFVRDPASVSEHWQHYFAEMTAEGGSNGFASGEPSFPRWSVFNPPGSGGDAAAADGRLSEAAMQERVDQLVRNFRVRGHRIAHLDPLDQPGPHPPELDPTHYGFTERDLDRPCSTRSMRGPSVRTLREIINSLQTTYCRHIGVQFMHIDDLAIREWLQERMETSENRIELSRETQQKILTRLTDAVVFEEFIQKKFIGAKSFSLEGAESLIPLLHLAIEKAGSDGIDEIVFGMAHRGRLNVLANIMGKSPRAIFREFEDVDPERSPGRGDVKYHLGYSSDWETESGQSVHLSLCFNPSHLEFVNPVAMGRIRAKQDRHGDTERRRGMALLIHGDAAFAGEGIVQESLNLSRLDAYRIGGTVHVVVNNQIGFTTGPQQGRSGIYCTDVAKMLQIPIFHVNGEHPEAVAQAVNLAMDFRDEFHCDVVIDMFCYRLRGHNEGDEPSFTQPILYDRIEKQKSVRENYLEHLLELHGLSRDEGEQIAIERRELLEAELENARSDDYSHTTDALGGIWNGYTGGPESGVPPVETGVEIDRLAALLHNQTVFPDDFHPHPKIQRAMKRRREMAAGRQPLDWSAAEALAFASIAADGYRIRMTGQDCERGTFSQRHAVLHDCNDGHPYFPLEHVADDQAPVEIANSPLSESGVMGFEYGYSLDWPDGLVLWEAQFGDFVNAAQVLIDQFIASAEDKWRRLSGLVLLLPHGFEGQGPEHSSARLERFLSLAAEDNLQVVVPTTPAQYFHMLRRQVLRQWRKPLIVMTPKSLLRHSRAVSSLDELQSEGFQRVIADTGDIDPKKVQRLLLCTGKLYYELEAARRERERNDVAIIRIEQLYPLSLDDLADTLAPYADDTPAFWVQEEPENMGAWRFLRISLGERLLDRFPLNCLESEKATFDAPAPVAGVLTKILKKSGDSAEVGEVIGLIEEGAEAEGSGQKDDSAESSKRSDDGKADKGDASDDSTGESESPIMPAAKRLLEQNDLDPADVEATGPGGRLLKEDVERHLEQAKSPERKKSADKSEPGRETETVAMSPLRRRIAQRLVESQRNAALLTTFNEVDMTAVIELRRAHRDAFQKQYGIKLGFMSFFVKAAVDALKQCPQLNAQIKDNDIIFHNYFDIGVAIGTEKGLVVPVLRNAERSSFAEIETAIDDFAHRARDGKLSVEDLLGGTFTISNGGIYGSMLSTPIVNPPQSGVLGMHAIQDRAVVRDGEIVIRPMMYLALSYDHRIVDGREAAMLESSELYAEAGAGLDEHGIQLQQVGFDLSRMLKRKDRIVSTLTKGIDSLFKKNKVERYTGNARFDGAGKIVVESNDGTEELKAEHIIIATGSQAATLPGVELDGDRIGTSTEALSYSEVPGHLVVIGAGYIGLEMGSVWRRLGAQVTVLEYLDRILPGTDAEIAKSAKKLFEKQGIEFRLQSRVTGATAKKKSCRVEIDEADPVECDRILVAVGRKPNTEGLNLESVDVETDESGRISVDEHFQTTAAGVYAIGDVIRGPMLAHKAEDEGVACVEQIVTGYGHVNYDAIPSVCYTHPEVAAVGKTEEQLQEDGIPYRKGSVPFRANARARTLAQTDGMIKMLAHEKTDRILGVHILGPRAGDLIAEAVAAIEFAATSEDIARCSHAHPTLSETLREAALAVDGRTLNM
eukprot:g12602.t1